MKNRRIFVLIFILLVCGAEARSAFKDTGWGARPAGMGGAYAAVSDDSNAVFYNPSGLALLNGFDSSYMYSDLYSGTDGLDMGQYFASAAYPVERIGSFGISWGRFSSADEYSEDTAVLSCARSLYDLLEMIYPEGTTYDILLGANIKYLQHGYVLDERTEDDPVFADGDSKSAVAYDLGIMSVVPLMNMDTVSVGLALNNINQPDVGLKSRDRVPAEVRVGASYKMLELGGARDVLAALDVSYRDSNNEKVLDNINIHCGTEAWFMKNLMGVRAGVNYNGFSSGLSVKKDISRYCLCLDYAFVWTFRIKDNSGSHRIALSFRYF
ncbi:MAG: hypothetical protein JXJ19_01670 [Elusimicrobia bacterium]|nr:hypothetical protein [Elusimicrobiota bacterium]